MKEDKETLSFYDSLINQGLSEEQILELFEYVKKASNSTGEEININWKYLSKHTVEIKPFIKNLSREDIDKFIELINTNIGNYQYMNTMKDSAQSVKEWARDDKSIYRHKSQIKEPLKNYG